MVADITPPHLRGAAFRLHQSLDTVGAFTGPLLAVALVLLWANDFRRVFWIAVTPAAMAVTLVIGIREPEHPQSGPRPNPIVPNALLLLCQFRISTSLSASIHFK